MEEEEEEEDEMIARAHHHHLASSEGPAEVGEKRASYSSHMLKCSLSKLLIIALKQEILMTHYLFSYVVIEMQLNTSISNIKIISNYFVIANNDN